MRRRHVLGLIAGSVGGAGCLSNLVGRRNGETRDTSNECSNASVTSVELLASTVGDTIVVRGTVSETPAPYLRGFIINTEGSEKHRDDISEPLGSRGNFSHQFGYPHHTIKDYAFWIEGCPESTPTPETDG